MKRAAMGRAAIPNNVWNATAIRIIRSAGISAIRRMNAVMVRAAMMISVWNVTAIRIILSVRAGATRMIVSRATAGQKAVKTGVYVIIRMSAWSVMVRAAVLASAIRMIVSYVTGQKDVMTGVRVILRSV